MNESQLAAARAWIADGMNGGEDFGSVWELTDNQVRLIVDRYYDGGVKQFIADCE